MLLGALRSPSLKAHEKETGTVGAGLDSAAAVWPLLQEATPAWRERWEWGAEGLGRGPGGIDRVWFSR